MEVVLVHNIKTKLALAHETLFRRKSATAGSKPARPNRLAFEPLEPRLILDMGTPVINEFMAINDSVLHDGEGDYPD